MNNHKINSIEPAIHNCGELVIAIKTGGTMRTRFYERFSEREITSKCPNCGKAIFADKCEFLPVDESPVIPADYLVEEN
jgi:hypothetical protein